MPKGRKPKYRTATEMREAIEAYFAECDEYTYLLDNEGKPVMYKGAPVYDKEPTPYTMTGLALFLGFTKMENVKKYIGKDENIDVPRDKELAESYDDLTFREVITQAITRVNQFQEEALYKKETMQGAKFALENTGSDNGFGRAKEIDLNIKAVGAIVSEEEAIKRLKELGFEEKK